MTDDMQLPRLAPTPLAPRAGEWEHIRSRARRAARLRTAAVSAVIVLAGATPLAAVALAFDRPAVDSVQPPVGASAAGVRTVDPQTLTRGHVEGEVDYPNQDRVPPVGGDHAPAPQTCGVYAEPVPDESAVHSLEHGAVWLTYRRELDAAGIERLRDVIAGAGSHGLLSPRAQEALVVATAWGHQLETDDAGDPRLLQFVEQYANGPQTPEVGAACDGTLGTQLLAEGGTTSPGECAGTVFRISTTGRPDGATPELAAAAFAARPGNGASFPIPPGEWTLLVQTPQQARVVNGNATLSLLASQGGWAVDGGWLCEGE